MHRKIGVYFRFRNALKDQLEGRATGLFLPNAHMRKFLPAWAQNGDEYLRILRRKPGDFRRRLPRRRRPRDREPEKRKGEGVRARDRERDREALGVRIANWRIS